MGIMEPPSSVEKQKEQRNEEKIKHWTKRKTQIKNDLNWQFEIIAVVIQISEFYRFRMFSPSHSQFWHVKLP